MHWAVPTRTQGALPSVSASWRWSSNPNPTPNPNPALTPNSNPNQAAPTLMPAPPIPAISAQQSLASYLKVELYPYPYP